MRDICVSVLFLKIEPFAVGGERQRGGRGLCADAAKRGPDVCRYPEEVGRAGMHAYGCE